MGKSERDKGIRGELQAIAYLRRLGFTVSDRSSQYRGGKRDGPDVTVDKRLYIEVKTGPTVRPGNTAMRHAMVQAREAAKAAGGGTNSYMVMTRGTRQQWLLTEPFIYPIDGEEIDFGTITYAGDEAIRLTIEERLAVLA